MARSAQIILPSCGYLRRSAGRHTDGECPLAGPAVGQGAARRSGNLAKHNTDGSYPAADVSLHLRPCSELRIHQRACAQASERKEDKCLADIRSHPCPHFHRPRLHPGGNQPVHM